MKLYRLKKEAVEYFDKKYATAIHDWDAWHKTGVDDNALEEVREPYLAHGIKTSEISSTLGGWDENGSRFCFTIYFPSVRFYEHDKFTSGKMTRELMNKIQPVISNFYNDFQP